MVITTAKQHRRISWPTSIVAIILCMSWVAAGASQSAPGLRVLARGEVVDENGHDEWDVVTLEPSGAHGGSDVSDADYARIDAAIRAYDRTVGRLPKLRTDVPNRYVFYPHAGLHEGDMFFSNFVDLDPAEDAILDWDCSIYTYDGHRGVDSTPRSFGFQDVGVPIYAALAGRVVDTQDGEPDRNKEWANQRANYVLIDHGGQIAVYTHMRKNSVAVSTGDMVVPGQQIGLMGSSGRSTITHLHFETRVDDEPQEAFAGPCRPGNSGFTKQPKFKRKTYIIDAGITHVDFRALPDAQQYPEQIPGGGQFQTDADVMYQWLLVRNLPADSTWRLVFRGPDRKIARDTGDQPFDNEEFWRRVTWRFRSIADDMRDVTGTWKVEHFINGKRMVVMPFEVVDKIDKGLNRPPAKLKNVKFARKPQAGVVPICQIKHPW